MKYNDLKCYTQLIDSNKLALSTELSIFDYICTETLIIAHIKLCILFKESKACQTYATEELTDRVTGLCWYMRLMKEHSLPRVMP